MKKFVLASAIILFCSFFSLAQSDEGVFMLEANTSFGATGDTGIYIASRDGDTSFNFGAEAGYFIMDDLALKAGLGFGDNDGTVISYKLGAKYYIIGQIPVAFDITGQSIEDEDDNPLFVGFQAGYAIFLNDHVALEPGLRYNLSLNEDASDSVLQLNVGFSIFF